MVKRSGGLSVMLVLSAVDLLTCALVCGVVLLVVLVGADPGLALSSARAKAAIPIFMEIVENPNGVTTVAGDAAKLIETNTLAGDVSLAELGYTSGSTKSRVSSYLLNSNASEITLQHLGPATVLHLYGGNEGNSTVLMLCDGGIEWSVALDSKTYIPIRMGCAAHGGARASLAWKTSRSVSVCGNLQPDLSVWRALPSKGCWKTLIASAAGTIPMGSDVVILQ